MASFKAGKYTLPLGTKTYVMGILNVTPDSFSDGGKWNDPGAAEEHALMMQEAGADILDIGAQSTRPGYTPVSFEEEWRRLQPVLDKLAGKLHIPISIDTFYYQVAQKALDAGADVINDVTGFCNDSMWNVAAHSDCGCIVMHDRENIHSISPFFHEQLKKAEQFGVKQERLCFDPGIGFGKTYEENLSIIKNLKQYCVPDLAMLVGASRKRVIGQPCGNPPFAERLYGTIAAHTIAIAGGADIIRVHDVPEAVQAAKVADAVLRTAFCEQ